MEELRDIRTLEPVSDLSLYLFIAVVAVALLVVGLILYKLIRYLRNRSRDNLRAKVLQRLKDLDLSDSKKAAYQMTRYGRYLANDDRSKKIFDQLQERLDQYKFIPDPPPIDQETRNYYRLFLEVVDG